VRAEVLTAERAVLYTLCFQLRIQAPYSTVLQLTKGQKDGQDTTNLIQMAWQLVNDRCVALEQLSELCGSCHLAALPVVLKPHTFRRLRH
jgi:hypothetical protein